MNELPPPNFEVAGAMTSEVQFEVGVFEETEEVGVRIPADQSDAALGRES